MSFQPDGGAATSPDLLSQHPESSRGTVDGPGIDELPNELLQPIIHDGVDKSSGGQLAVCSLVCKRWRDIAMPQLFRLVAATQAHTGGSPKCLQVLASELSILAFVQELSLSRIDVDIELLSSLLEKLPRLYALKLDRVNFLNSTAERSQSFRKGYVLKLLWCNFHDSSSHRFDHVFPLLSLFGEIGRLELLDNHYDHPDVTECLTAASEAAPSLAGSLQIDTLQVFCDPLASAFFPIYLWKAGALRHLTQLILDVQENSTEERLASVSEILTFVGSTLTSFTILLSQGWDWFSSEHVANRRQTLVGILRPGLAACTRLETFLLDTTVYIDVSFDPSPYFSRQSWITAAEIISHVPSDNLRDLTLKFRQDEFELEQIHRFAWARLREACRLFPHLQFLDIEMPPEIQHDCVVYEMQEFDEILVDHFDSEALNCTFIDCLQFNSGLDAEDLI